MWRNQGFFRELLDNLYDGVYFVDRDMVITYWNKGAERLSGFTPVNRWKLLQGHILVHMDNEGNLL